MGVFKVLSPTAILGYGFPEESFAKAMELRPDAIAVDAGSTDPGPYYLGAGVSFTDRDAVKRDLTYMLRGAVEASIPLLIGSSGGSGAKPHVDWTLDIIREIAAGEKLSFNMAVIYSDIPRELVSDALAKGHVEPLYPAKPLTDGEIGQSTYIVGQMGLEPFMQALDMGAQVIVAGRAYDPSMFAAPAIRVGYDKALALHMGKILECACIAATPGSGSDCMMGMIGEDYFDVMPINPIRKATVTSVAAHTLYEKSNPYILPGPGGSLDLTACGFEQLPDGMVRVRGSRFVPTEDYTVKLEAAKPNGYRTICVAGTRDPVMIAGIEDISQEVKRRVAQACPHIPHTVLFKFYGKNAVMGEMETRKELPHELGVLIDVVADTQAHANTVCSLTRSTMLHYGYEGRISTAGNLAFPYSPSDISMGRTYCFSIYHLIKDVDFTSVFKVIMRGVG